MRFTAEPEPKTHGRGRLADRYSVQELPAVRGEQVGVAFGALGEFRHWVKRPIRNLLINVEHCVLELCSVLPPQQL